MADDDNAKEAINQASADAAMEAAAAPTYINRFEILPAQLDDHVILALGGAAYGGLADRDLKASAKMIAGCMLSRRIAVDIARRLLKEFGAEAEAHSENDNEAGKREG